MSLPRKTTLIDPQNWNKNYRGLLLQIAVSRVNDYQIAEDLVQDTFISAWKGKDRFRGECSEKSYLCGILKNKVIDFYRARGRKPTVIASQITDNNGDEDTRWMENRADTRFGIDPTIAAEKEDFMDQLNRAVDKLPPKMAKAFRLWQMNDLTTAEVTRILNITESNLWVSIHRAKKLLRSELGGEWDNTTFVN